MLRNVLNRFMNVPGELSHVKSPSPTPITLGMTQRVRLPGDLQPPEEQGHSEHHLGWGAATLANLVDGVSQIHDA